MKKVVVYLLIAMMILAEFPMSVEAKAKTKLNRTKLTLKVGKTFRLKVKNVDKKSTVRWRTSKKKVATVSKKGKVTAKRKGTAKITAKVKGTNGKVKKYICTVKVKNKKKNTTKPTAAPTPTPQIIYVEVTPTPEISQKPMPTSDVVTPDGPVVTATPTPVPEGNLTYQSDVTAEMAKAEYWIEQCENPDEVMLDAVGIEEANAKMRADSNTSLNDLLSRPETYDGTTRKTNLANAIDSDVKTGRVNGRTFYLDGVQVEDADAFFEDIKENILGAETTSADPTKYGLCVKRAEMKMAPVEECVGWSATDPDDEFLNSALNVNEPIIIEAVTADGKFYWGRGLNCNGWVAAENIALCDDKETWKSMWTGTGEDILVVTTNRITLAASNLIPESSKLELMLGTTLPLVPEDEVPEQIGERGTWYNYVVYVPTRDEQGKFVRSVALISMNQNVSVGYLPFTKRNVLNVAFTCLGERYGWGGMLDAMDCSLYTRCIYKCFGFELPRNTTWQTKIPSDNIDLSGMTDEEKKEAIRSCEPGSLLMFSGHITMYIGEANGKLYVISAVGSLAESETAGEEVNVQSMYGVAVNSLDVRRRSGNTWLTSLITAVRPWKYAQS